MNAEAAIHVSQDRTNWLWGSGQQISIRNGTASGFNPLNGIAVSFAPANGLRFAYKYARLVITGSGTRRGRTSPASTSTPTCTRTTGSRRTSRNRSRKGRRADEAARDALLVFATGGDSSTTTVRRARLSRARSRSRVARQNDLTYRRLTAPDDVAELDQQQRDLWLERALDTAAVSGQIAEVIVKARAARINATNCAGQYDVVMNGQKVGTADTLTATITNYSRTFTTDPADGQPWTDAKINSKTWGAVLSAQSTAPSFNRNPTASLYRMVCRIWGQDAQPSPLQVGAALIAPLVVPERRNRRGPARGRMLAGHADGHELETEHGRIAGTDQVAAELVAPKVTVQDFGRSRGSNSDAREHDARPFRPTDPVGTSGTETRTRSCQDLWLSGTHAGTLAVGRRRSRRGRSTARLNTSSSRPSSGSTHGRPHGRYVASRIRWITGGVSGQRDHRDPGDHEHRVADDPGEFPLDIFEAIDGADPANNRTDNRGRSGDQRAPEHQGRTRPQRRRVRHHPVCGRGDLGRASGIENRGTEQTTARVPDTDRTRTQAHLDRDEPDEDRNSRCQKPLKFTMPLGG